MRAYIIRRLLLIIPTLFILSILVFLSVRFIPGDAIDAMLGKNEFISGEVDREALERMLGLDVPVHVQYGRWIRDIFLRGSLGRSLVVVPDDFDSSQSCLRSGFPLSRE